MRLRSRYATRSSIDAGLLLLVGAILLAAGLAVYVIGSERRRHHDVEGVNARLLKEVTEREAERSGLAERIITAEQDERRRLALFLHDGPVQNLSGIALMLDAAVYAIDDGRPDDARGIMSSALEKHRDTIRSLRDLSFNIEPVVLRDQGFAPAVRELADQLGMEHALQIDLDVARAERLPESVQVGLYQIIRESSTRPFAGGRRRVSRSSCRRPRTAVSRRSSPTTGRASAAAPRSTRSSSAPPR